MSALENLIIRSFKKLLQRGVQTSKARTAKQRREWQANRPVYSPPERQAPRPGWMLNLRSPFEAPRPVTSWMGGLPRVPTDFTWPRDRNGKPLMFLAQIDLADIAAEPETGQRPAGLEETGAILMFFPLWGEAPQAHTLTAEQMLNATPMQAPDDLAQTEAFEFWESPNRPKVGLVYWPVDLVPYFQTANDRPVNAVEWPGCSPMEWAQTNAMAAMDAEAVATALRNHIRFATKFLDKRTEPQPDEPKHVSKERASSHVLLAQGPKLLGAIEAYLANLANNPPADPPDMAAMEALYASRKELAHSLGGSEEKGYHHPIYCAVLGQPTGAWQKLLHEHPYLHDFEAAASLPIEFRPFAEQMITLWHGHYFYGHSQFCVDGSPTAENALFYLSSDGLLGSQSEHEDGFSICYPKGSNPSDHTGTHYILDRHTNV